MKVEMRKLHQKLPAAGPEREALRQKGQFWTPAWVAEAMVKYVVADGSDHVFDPAVGAGAFFLAAKAVAREGDRDFRLFGTEIDREALEQARQNGLSENDLSRIQIGDFTLNPPPGKFKAIVANPPYIRHHRLTAQTKAELKQLGARLIGIPLDGRAGLHVYFLLRALQLLEEGGRLAFIMPADTCEGVFSSELWEWIANNYCLDALMTFAPEATPFPGVDTNPLVFLIKNQRPQENFLWARCLRPETGQLKEWMASDFKQAGDAIEVHQRQLLEGLATGLSRTPAGEQTVGPILADFAKVMRGIATGANEFFFLTKGEAARLGIAAEFLIPAIGRTRDVPGDQISPENILALEAQGKPTLLFSPDGRSLNLFPQPVREYLMTGEASGLHRKTLIATRRPWYKMERRSVPPILFAYLGRRNARFIRNLAGVVPLTGFLCLYPHHRDSGYVNNLWEVLRHPETIANLSRVGKTYGSGAIKVEPRALEKLPLPISALAQSGLKYEVRHTEPRPKQDVQPFLPLT